LLKILLHEVGWNENACPEVGILKISGIQTEHWYERSISHRENVLNKITHEDR
jgi:hypothetical protein